MLFDEQQNAGLKVPCNTSKNGASLDTLAQLGTTNMHTSDDDDFDVCATTNITDKKTLLKRARRKYFSNGLTLKLVDSAKTNPYSVLQKSYWNTYHCSATLSLRGSGKVNGTYCKCRWCMVCNAIRTAVCIKKYSPVFANWSDMYFVTLTQRTVPFEKLSSQIDEMQSIFSNIKGSVKKQYQRKNIDFKMVGVRKLECTYNTKSKRYHPHYHFIVQSKEMALMLRSEWLKRNANAQIQAQDVRKANTNSAKELFKYMTKVVCKTEDGQRAIPSVALDNIFNALRGRRVLQNFGFRLPKSSASVTTADIDDSEVIAILEWQDAATDWVNVDTGECITGYTPSDGMASLIE